MRDIVETLLAIAIYVFVMAPAAKKELTATDKLRWN